MGFLKGCRYSSEGGKVLWVFHPHLLYYSKSIKQYTLTSFNTCIIPVARELI